MLYLQINSAGRVRHLDLPRLEFMETVRKLGNMVYREAYADGYGATCSKFIEDGCGRLRSGSSYHVATMRGPLYRLICDAYSVSK
jgi:hypothetical protein